MIAPDAQIGEGTIIQPGVFIGNDVKIGRDCMIHAGVIIGDGSRIGDRVTIHSGTVLGGDAFYYKHRADGYDKLLSTGYVEIQDDVDLGALCTIDRGVSASTVIGAGSKLDNQVHVGHDTIIGRECLIAAQAGIAGCCVIEDKVTIWGQVGMAAGVTIGSGAVILAQSGVSKSLEGGKTYFGYPAEEAQSLYKQMATLRLLPKWLKKKGII
jgi:UDP-3-O-[3-hydroxymyristoyl] glucosamine N-acyltransferase